MFKNIIQIVMTACKVETTRSLFDMFTYLAEIMRGQFTINREKQTDSQTHIITQSWSINCHTAVWLITTLVLFNAIELLCLILVASIVLKDIVC